MRWFGVVCLGVILHVVSGCGGQSERDGDDGATGNGTGGSGATGNGTGGSGATGNGGSMGDPADWQTACTRAAEVSCSKWQQCLPDLAESILPADCDDSVTASCMNSTRLPGIALTPSIYAACTEAFNRMNCDEWLYGGGVPVECRGFRGTRPDGSACGESGQCASGACSAELGCGVCEPRVPLGGDCSERFCENGLECGVGELCIDARYLGEPCGIAEPCVNTLACEQGFCVKLPGEGAPCRTDAIACDLLQFLTCDPETRLCVRMVVSDVGEACIGYCRAGTFCGDAGICVGALAEGAPCSPDSAACDRMLECIGGVCTRFDPNTCG